MKITRIQLRNLIQESYRELHRQQARSVNFGNVDGVGPISISPSKEYYRALLDRLYRRGIDSQHKGYSLYELSNGQYLRFPPKVSYPHGFAIYRNDDDIKFAVTGNPEVDGEFIERLCSLSDDDFSRISAKTSLKKPRVGSWESEIIEGYPHRFIGL